MIVRPARSGDAPALAAIYAPFVTDSAISLEDRPPDAAEMAARMAAGGALYPWLVAEVDGAPVGYASASRFRPRVGYRFTTETSVYVALERHGQGAGRLLYGRLLEILIAQGFTQAIAAVTLPNAGSERLHAAFGFAACGTYERVGWKLGQYWDVGLFQRALAPAVTPPAEPRPFAEV